MVVHDVADSKEVRHVGAHLNVHVNEAAIGDCHTGSFSRDLFAVGLRPTA
jgi:hypothetical protein